MTTMKREHIVALPYFHDNTEHFCIADNFYDNNEKGTHCCTSMTTLNTSVLLTTTSMTTMKREHAAAFTW